MLSPFAAVIAAGVVIPVYGEDAEKPPPPPPPQAMRENTEKITGIRAIRLTGHLPESMRFV
jgi:hypothetical protein